MPFLCAVSMVAVRQGPISALGAPQVPRGRLLGRINVRQFGGKSSAKRGGENSLLHKKTSRFCDWLFCGA